ncbi:protoporphyrinogen oxidase [Hamadaea sp. NPDC051192]|uniref:protoporphyrinogen oxidase n=1 Tax=Hamadaea sp. NPDC051192 TaxID=3154940 RepID=UPI003427084C
MSTRHVVVVGGGVAGLTAALRLAESGVRVTLVEATARLGGKIQTAGDGIETGAEQFLMRTPDGGPSGAARLVADLELGDRLVHPALGAAGLWVDGRLHPMPTGTLMGVPGFSAALDGVATLADDDRDLGVPVLSGQDVAVGELVRSRLGGAVVEHLVDPLLGGVYAGRADLLSLQATIPNLYAALQTAHTLRDGVAASLVKRSAGGPVFGTLRGGLSRLIEALSHRLLDLGVAIHYGTPLRALDELDADAYVLACPAKPAAALLPPAVADLVGELDYASIGLVSMRLPGADLPALTGFLVPADQGLSIKAATFFSRKWEHLAGEPEAAVRVSVGRYGDVGALAMTDEALGAAVQADLAKVVGPLPAASAVRVTRWGGALPQYAPGHVDRVAEARALLGAGRKPVVLAGAAFDGVGIPVCIASGEKAAADLGEFVS